MVSHAQVPGYEVRRVAWAASWRELASVRRTVFIEEQSVPEDLEWDGDDAEAMHVLASHDGTPIGTGRLLRDGRIGRMAVLPSWRGQGVGGAILETLVATAAELGYPAPRLHAQTHALPFYARHGFVAVGEEFLEAGIPHRTMVLPAERYAAKRARS